MVRDTKADKKPIKPLLRWAGGKQQLAPKLLNFAPDGLDDRMYFEPFLGAACLYFSLQPRNARLSDANEHLVKTYQAVADDWRVVDRHLSSLRKQTNKDTYYAVRAVYNRSGFSFAQAARFIFLNRTCFNGIFRVNTRGEFNVPYGYKRRPPIPSSKELQSASDVLKRARIKSSGYRSALAGARSGHFVYLDPPYPPLNGTSYFTHYTAERFGVSEQHKVADLFKDLDRRGCLVMMTNANTKLIRELYKDFRQVRLPVIRFITCKAKRYKVGELVITNYL